MTAATHVFVVDSDPSARVGLVRLFRRAGHDALSFASLADLLDALKPHTPGCLVLDSETAWPTSVGLRDRLEAHGAPLPIIVVSVKDDHRTRQTARGLRAVGFFRKPVDGPALLDSVKWALEGTEMA